MEAYCRHWHKAMPFMFEREGDYTELLMPTALLAADSVRDRAVKTLTEDVCGEVEVIGIPVHADLVGRSLTGSWRATLDGVPGEWRIVEQAPGRFTGALTLEDGTQYDVVSGWYDSRPLMFRLHAPSGAISRVEGIHCAPAGAG